MVILKFVAILNVYKIEYKYYFNLVILNNFSQSLYIHFTTNAKFALYKKFVYLEYKCAIT